MAQVRGERLIAERALRPGHFSRREDVKAQFRALVAGVRDIVTALSAAAPTDKAAIYAELGVSLTYHPGGQVLVEARPYTEERVGEGDCSPGYTRLPRPATSCGLTDGNFYALRISLSSIPRSATTRGPSQRTSSLRGRGYPGPAPRRTSEQTGTYRPLRAKPACPIWVGILTSGR